MSSSSSSSSLPSSSPSPPLPSEESPPQSQSQSQSPPSIGSNSEEGLESLTASCIGDATRMTSNGTASANTNNDSNDNNDNNDSNDNNNSTSDNNNTSNSNSSNSNGNDTNTNNPTTTTKRKKTRKLRPKLQPISTPEKKAALRKMEQQQQDEDDDDDDDLFGGVLDLFARGSSRAGCATTTTTTTTSLENAINEPSTITTATPSTTTVVGNATAASTTITEPAAEPAAATATPTPATVAPFQTTAATPCTIATTTPTTTTTETPTTTTITKSITTPTTTTTTKSKTKSHRPTLKLQPRSTLFSPDNAPDTPDDDGYGAFGFGLLRTPGVVSSSDVGVGDDVSDVDGVVVVDDGDVGRGVVGRDGSISVNNNDNEGGDEQQQQQQQQQHHQCNKSINTSSSSSSSEEEDEYDDSVEEEGNLPFQREICSSSPLDGLSEKHYLNKDDNGNDGGGNDDNNDDEEDADTRVILDNTDDGENDDNEKGILKKASHCKQQPNNLQQLYPKDELEEYIHLRRNISRDIEREHDNNNERQTPTTTPTPTPPQTDADDLAYSLDQEEGAFHRQMSTLTNASSIFTQPSNVSFRESAQEIDASSTIGKTEPVHLIGGSFNRRSSSEEDVNDNDDDDVSFNSDSTFTPSDGESSYFSAKRASMETNQQQQQQQQMHHYYHQFHHPQNNQQPPQYGQPPQQYGQPQYYYPMQYPIPPYSNVYAPNPHPQQQQQSQPPPPLCHNSSGAQRRPPARPVHLPIRSNSAPIPPSSSRAGGGVSNTVEMKLSLSASEDDDDNKHGGSNTKDVYPKNNSNEVQEECGGDGRGLNLFLKSSSRRRGIMSSCSSIVESASSEEEEDDHDAIGSTLSNNEKTSLTDPNLDKGDSNDGDGRQTTTTPFSNGSASTDDAGVVNELNAYSTSVTSATSGRGKKSAEAKTDSAPLSGRLTPVEGRHAKSVLLQEDMDTPTPTHGEGARNFYANTQSAMMAATTHTSAAKPQAHSDSSFVNHFREGDWSTIPKGSSNVGDTISVSSSIVHSSPRGAFNDTTEGRSPRQVASQQQYSQLQYQLSPHAPQNINQPSQPCWGSDGRLGGPPSVEPTSLAYSDEDENENARIGFKSSPFRDRTDAGVDEEVAMEAAPHQEERNKFKVYSSRWIMLLYMSVLNLLSDWTCYSIAPIALLTIDKFGDGVDPESLVTVFLSANAVASACEPAILGRLGLRKTVVFGALLLMIGSIIKSGGAPFMGQSLGEGDGWRLYLGFFLVGLSQPLYQCTPALLSASWFPENERTMATGVALNSNQLGIGFSFVFGTLLVASRDDIVPYFQFLSFISTVAFIGCAMQFDDAPPTPPSDTARVIRGTLEIKIPNLPGMFFIRSGEDKNDKASSDKQQKSSKHGSRRNSNSRHGSSKSNTNDRSKQRRRSSKNNEERKSRQGTGAKDSKKKAKTKKIDNAKLRKAPFLPSPAYGDEPTALAVEVIENNKSMVQYYALAQAPSPMMPGPVVGGSIDEPTLYGSTDLCSPDMPVIVPTTPNDRISDASDAVSSSPFPNLREYYHQHGDMVFQPGFGYYDFGRQFHPESQLPPTEHDGVEPIMTQTPHQLDINIRDDQIWLSVKACFARKGFAHCVVAFTTSGIVINTLSTFMDYLVRLQGAGREYVGIVGGTFQLLIMIASMIFGSWTDKSRKYYFAIIALLAMGAFMLSVCSVDLDGDRGHDLRLTLLAVAVLAGPLQPLSTELGVEVVYPLSENTVLVIQQLFSNLLSAAFIPVFKMLRDVGTVSEESNSNQAQMFEVPQYTFSFYMLVVMHALATIYFASFNGLYLRYEEEIRKKREKQYKDRNLNMKNANAYYGVTSVTDENYPFLIPQN